MNEEEEFENSLIEAAKQLPDVNTPTVEAFDETLDLEPIIRNEALRVRGDFRMATDAADRHELQGRYEKLDRWLGELKRIESLPDTTQVESELQQLRGDVLEDLRKWRSKERRRQQELDAKHKEVRERARTGGGPAGFRRIKSELEMLLKNYSPLNESRIETLIEQWRRSGDPSYDPGIQARFRNVRRKKEGSKFAL